MVESLKRGLKDDGSVIDAMQGIIDGRGNEIGQDHF